jgi:hypothetical protein
MSRRFLFFNLSDSINFENDRLKTKTTTTTVAGQANELRREEINVRASIAVTSNNSDSSGLTDRS